MQEHKCTSDCECFHGHLIIFPVLKPTVCDRGRTMDVTDGCELASIFIYRDAQKHEIWGVVTANTSRVCKLKTQLCWFLKSQKKSFISGSEGGPEPDSLSRVFVSTGSSQKPQIQESGGLGKGRYAPLSQRPNLQPWGIPGTSSARWNTLKAPLFLFKQHMFAAHHYVDLFFQSLILPSCLRLSFDSLFPSFPPPYLPSSLGCASRLHH